MHQLPLLGTAIQGPAKSPGALRTDDNIGLLAGNEGAMAGFSGDLQSMLMQLSPQMLQRLNDLLTGGMDLPQAARSLLGELGGGLSDGLFADVLQQRLPRPGEALAFNADGAGRGAAAGGLLPGALQPAGGPPIDIAGGASPLLSLAGFHPAGAGPNATQLPTPLVGSLLEMGVPQQVGTRGWDSAIADRVMWMLQGDQQFARLKLNPPNLGPLEVRVSVHQDQTSVSFLASHAAVREALEASLPRLREFFDQQNLQLVRAEVADPGAQQGDRAGGSVAQSSPGLGLLGDDPDPEGEVATPLRVAVAKGLIDLFA